MISPKFQVSSIKYENLSNRMERLRHSQNHSNSTSNLRCASVQVKENKPITRVASTAFLNNNLVLTNLQEESSFDIGSKYSGRVTKNTGIRKYNQRMLRDVGNINRKTPPKVEQTQFTKPISPAKYIPRANYEVCAPKPVTSTVQRIKLEPGKIYTKEELEKYFAS